MKFGWKQCVMALLLGLATLGAAGCAVVAVGAAAGAGASTVGYIRGEYVENVPVSQQRLREAVTTVAQQSGLAFINEKTDEQIVVLTYRDEKDDKWVIALDPITENSTQIRVRVGLFGDEGRSRAFLDRVKRYLL
ncbi:MAG: hypothetical protein E1N59_184 [Puniceicoccaceae bacterium 5H]|nr:MAG: hypothetical protein E1N59_184 [Puniceicoccaceae bacterium 5H]